MICNGCGNQAAIRIRMTETAVVCDFCGKLKSLAYPDVYFESPYLDPHLVDVKKPEQKDGVWIESKRHKAQVMRELGVREAGDRKGGSRNFDPKIKGERKQ